MITHLQRAPLLLLIFAVGLLADHLASNSTERVLFLRREDTTREGVAYLRPLLWLLTLASLLVAAFHPWPIGLFGAALLHAGLSTALLRHGARRVTRGSERPLKIPASVYALPEDTHFLRQLSPPVQLFHVSLVLISGFAFRWLLPHLPSVTRSLGGGAISPTKLWWGLSVPALNIALMLFVIWGINRERWRTNTEGEAPDIAATDQLLLDYRRALLCRFVEVLLVSINIAALVVWLGAAFGIAVGVREGLSSNVAVVVCAFVGLMSLYAIFRYIVPLARIRRELGERVQPGEREDAYRLGGALYFAPEDPALFVPRKQGYGSTLNFGRPSAWLFVLVVTLGPLLLAWWIL